MMQAHSDALLYSQEAARCCHLNKTYFKRSKWSDKGQHQTCPRFWCGEYLCKITKRYWQFLQSYRVHKATWPWEFESSKRSHKGQCRTRPRFLCREHRCNVTTWYKQSTKGYRVHKVPDATRHAMPVSLRGLRGKKVTQMKNFRV